MLTRTNTYPTALCTALGGQPVDMTETIQYRVSMGGSGWTDVKGNGAMADTKGGTTPLGSVRVWLGGDLIFSSGVYAKAQVNKQ